MVDYVNQLRNKLLYKIHTLTYDEDAETYASAATNKSSEPENVQTTKKRGVSEFFKDVTQFYRFSLPVLPKGTERFQTNIETDPDASGVQPPPSISATSILSQALAIIHFSMGFIIAAIFAMIVSNQFIMQPKTIRIIMFIFTYVMVLINPLIMFGMFLYYIGRSIYVAFVNSNIKLTNPAEYDVLKMAYLPHIFALLPISITQGETQLARILKYPFFYPKTEKSRKNLENDMDKYFKYVRGGIINIDGLENDYPVLKSKLEEYRKKIIDMHRPSSA